ncbi:MAG: sugar kinase [Alphaproteobacteria bacterium]|nr:sugar kinase [Alphaproteobacteria bacterium]
MSAPEFVALGEPLLEFSQQPPGADGRRLFLEGFGGDTSNAVVAAARQGVRTAYLTAIGRDPAGERFLALWAEEGVNTEGVRVADLSPTGIYFAMHGPAGHSFLYHRTGSAASGYGPADVDEAVVARARILYASGISQAISSSAADAVFHAMAVARAAGVRIAYDTNYRPRLWPPARASAVIHAAVAQADIALPSLEDATALTGLTEPDAIVDFYLRLGPRMVALKLGAEGVLLASADARTHLPAHGCRFVDATGAGDTFCGAFLARLILGDAPVEAARYALIAAALKCEGFGAVVPIPRAAEVQAALIRG